MLHCRRGKHQINKKCYRSRKCQAYSRCKPGMLFNLFLNSAETLSPSIENCCWHIEFFKENPQGNSGGQQDCNRDSRTGNGKLPHIICHISSLLARCLWLFSNLDKKIFHHPGCIFLHITAVAPRNGFFYCLKSIFKYRFVFPSGFPKIKLTSIWEVLPIKPQAAELIKTSWLSVGEIS